MPHRPENGTYWWLSTSGPSHRHHPGSTAPTELGEAEDQGHEEGYQSGPRWQHKQEGPAHLYPFKCGRRQRDLTLGTAAQEPLSTEGKIPLQKIYCGEQRAWLAFQSRKGSSLVHAAGLERGAAELNPTNDELTLRSQLEAGFAPTTAETSTSRPCALLQLESVQEKHIWRGLKSQTWPQKKASAQLSDGYTSTRACFCSSCSLQPSGWRRHVTYVTRRAHSCFTIP